MINVGIVGGTGYTGVELLRLLAQHPEAGCARSRRARTPARRRDMFRACAAATTSRFSDPTGRRPRRVRRRVLRHAARRRDGAGARAASAPACGSSTSRPISACRIRRVFERWYKMPHACPDLLAEAVYGLPEINREAIRKARIVGNPGCYPTAVQLGFLPLRRGGRRRHGASDRRLQIRRVRRRTQGGAGAAVRRGVGQFRGLRRRRAIATSRDRPGAEPGAARTPVAPGRSRRT